MAWAIFSMLFLAIGGVVYGAAALIWFALTILANWLMFMKAGEAGWKSIIPVYNTYTAYTSSTHRLPATPLPSWISGLTDGPWKSEPLVTSSPYFSASCK